TTTVLPLLTIGDVSQAEGNTTSVATVTATLSAASPFTTTVNFATADGTATVANNDYVATGGSLTFAPGVTSQAIPVAVVGDRLNEPNETFSVNLSGASNAFITDPQAIATLTNDDAAGLSIGDVVVAEGRLGNTTASYTVTLSPVNPTQTVTVN